MVPGKCEELLSCSFILINCLLLIIYLNLCRIIDSLHANDQIDGDETEFFQETEPQIFASRHSIHFPLPDSSSLMEKVLLLTFHCLVLSEWVTNSCCFSLLCWIMHFYFKLQIPLVIFISLYFPQKIFMLWKHFQTLFQIKRFQLLLTVKDKALDVPSNLEARRRISFFSTSLFMDIPSAPKVRNMLSFRLSVEMSFFLIYFFFYGSCFHKWLHKSFSESLEYSISVKAESKSVAF